MKQSQFNKLEMMMLADSNRNVVFGNELMVDDNFLTATWYSGTN